jgi:hypothetical protein
VELIDKSILLHLIPTPTSLSEALSPNFNKRLTDWISASQDDEDSYSKIIHLHQDVWLNKNEIVKSRLLVQSGATNPKRIFARKTIASRINATYAMTFLEDHHLWGATRAKYYYGLFQIEIESQHKELVAVATFSARRKVQRTARTFKSHELLRYCAQRDITVVGGISKLCKQLIRDAQPDDIITVVDRDWGDGSGWHSLGFETVSIMDPLVMVVNPNELGKRRYLVGASIQNDSNHNNTGRLGLPMETLAKLDLTSNPEDALHILAQENNFAVYDVGVERLLNVISIEEQDNVSAKILWKHSQPKYASKYYSDNAGITSLLQYAASGGPPLDSESSFSTTSSWRSTSGTASSAKLIFSQHSSMDLNAIVEVRERDSGWRTVGIVGGTNNPSIYHGIYKVDRNGEAEPTAVVSEFIKTMAVLSLAGQNFSKEEKVLRFLHFGYGAGTLVRLLAHHVHNSQHIAVEIDSGVVDANNNLLSSPPNVSLHVGDALEYEDTEPFDCICIDVFDGNLKVPETFYSEEYFAHLSKNLLTPKGILVQNFHSGGKKRRLVLEKAAAAASFVFAESCWVESLDSKVNAGNSILFASKSSLLEDTKDDIVSNLSENALAIQNKYGFTFDAPDRVRRAARHI